MLLEKEFKRLEEATSHADKIAPTVSAKGVDWHLEHTLRSLIVMAQATIDSDPKEYKPQFNFKRFVIFNLGKIPRGKARAPKVVVPPEEIDMDKVNGKFGKARQVLENLQKVEENKFFTHPYFGDLNKKHTIRMIELHTRHHLAIIDDIIKAAND